MDNSKPVEIPQPRDVNVIEATRRGWLFGRFGYLKAVELDADEASREHAEADGAAS